MTIWQLIRTYSVVFNKKTAWQLQNLVDVKTALNNVAIAQKRSRYTFRA